MPRQGRTTRSVVNRQSSNSISITSRNQVTLSSSQNGRQEVATVSNEPTVNVMVNRTTKNNRKGDVQTGYNKRNDENELGEDDFSDIPDDLYEASDEDDDDGMYTRLYCFG